MKAIYIEGYGGPDCWPRRKAGPTAKSNRGVFAFAGQRQGLEYACKVSRCVKNTFDWLAMFFAFRWHARRCAQHSPALD